VTTSSDLGAPPPKEPPPALPLRAARPTAVRLRQSVVRAAIMGAAALLSGSLAWAFIIQPELRSRTRQDVRVEEARGAVRPADIVAEQPGRYDQLGQLPEPRKPFGREAQAEDSTRDQPTRSRPSTSSSQSPRGPSAIQLARKSGLFFEASGAGAQPASKGNPGSAAIHSDYGAVYNSHNLLEPLSPFELKAGAIVPAALLTAVDTARAGPVVATVTQNVFDSVSGRHLLLPQGTRLIGRHDGESAYGDRRAFITWDRLILPNGKSLVLTEEPGVDAQGAVGVRGRVDRRLLPLMVATLFAGAITTVGQMARDEDDDSGGFLGDAGDAASIEAARVGGRLIDRELQVRPSIHLRAGAPVRVLITRDLVLEPYRR
jgi:type IV secretion system protein VirB10